MRNSHLLLPFGASLRFELIPALGLLSLTLDLLSLRSRAEHLLLSLSTSLSLDLLSLLLRHLRLRCLLLSPPLLLRLY